MYRSIDKTLLNRQFIEKGMVVNGEKSDNT